MADAAAMNNYRRTPQQHEIRHLIRVWLIFILVAFAGLVWFMLRVEHILHTLQAGLQ